MGGHRYPLVATGPAPGFESSAKRSARVAPFTFPTPDGPVEVSNVPGFTVVEIPEQDLLGDNRIGLVCYDWRLAQGERVGRALMFNADPDEARMIAAGLLRMAARIDPRKPS